MVRRDWCDEVDARTSSCCARNTMERGGAGDEWAEETARGAEADDRWQSRGTVSAGPSLLIALHYPCTSLLHLPATSASMIIVRAGALDHGSLGADPNNIPQEQGRRGRCGAEAPRWEERHRCAGAVTVRKKKKGATAVLHSNCAHARPPPRRPLSTATLARVTTRRNEHSQVRFQGNRLSQGRN